MYRHKLNDFCKNSDENIYEFKVISFQNDKIQISIFDSEEFSINIHGNGEFVSI